MQILPYPTELTATPYVLNFGTLKIAHEGAATTEHLLVAPGGSQQIVTGSSVADAAAAARAVIPHPAGTAIALVTLGRGRWMAAGVELSREGWKLLTSKIPPHGITGWHIEGGPSALSALVVGTQIRRDIHGPVTTMS